MVPNWLVSVTRLIMPPKKITKMKTEDKNKNNIIGFEVFMVVIMMNTIFWYTAPCKSGFVC
jgi:hypothetical protein